MKERPLPFKGPMVLATQSGVKKVTRRIVRGQQPNWDQVWAEWDIKEREFFMVAGSKQPSGLRPILGSVTCPYGQVGDRLWTKEAYRVSKRHDGMAPRDLEPRTMTVFYEAGGSRANDDKGAWLVDPTYPIGHPAWVGRYRNSMFMMRWMSRLTLEVTAVSIERLQDISEADAIDEGIERRRDAGDDPSCWRVYGTADTYTSDPISSYQSLWETINGIGSWDINPYVWRVAFRKVES